MSGDQDMDMILNISEEEYLMAKAALEADSSSEPNLNLVSTNLQQISTIPLCPPLTLPASHLVRDSLPNVASPDPQPPSPKLLDPTKVSPQEKFPGLQMGDLDFNQIQQMLRLKDYPEKEKSLEGLLELPQQESPYEFEEELDEDFDFDDDDDEFIDQEMGRSGLRDDDKSGQRKQRGRRRQSKNTVVACEHCRANHLKCDGQDTCSQCKKKELPCTYRSQQVRKPRTSLLQELRKHQDTIDYLKQQVEDQKEAASKWEMKLSALHRQQQRAPTQSQTSSSSSCNWDMTEISSSMQSSLNFGDSNSVFTNFPGVSLPKPYSDYLESYRSVVISSLGEPFNIPEVLLHHLINNQNFSLTDPQPQNYPFLRSNELNGSSLASPQCSGSNFDTKIRNGPSSPIMTLPGMGLLGTPSFRLDIAMMKAHAAMAIGSIAYHSVRNSDSERHLEWSIRLATHLFTEANYDVAQSLMLISFYFARQGDKQRASYFHALAYKNCEDLGCLEETPVGKKCASCVDLSGGVIHGNGGGGLSTVRSGILLTGSPKLRKSPTQPKRRASPSNLIGTSTSMQLTSSSSSPASPSSFPGGSTRRPRGDMKADPSNLLLDATVARIQELLQVKEVDFSTPNPSHSGSSFNEGWQSSTVGSSLLSMLAVLEEATLSLKPIVPGLDSRKDQRAAIHACVTAGCRAGVFDRAGLCLMASTEADKTTELALQVDPQLAPSCMVFVLENAANIHSKQQNHLMLRSDLRVLKRLAAVHPATATKSLKKFQLVQEGS